MRVLLVLVLVVCFGGVVWFLGGGDGGQSGLEPRIGGVGGEPLGEEKDLEMGAGEAHREVVVEKAEPVAEPSIEPDSKSDLDPGGVVLRGVVRWESGEAVSWLRLVLRGDGGRRCAVVSDGEGRFESEAIFGPGQLRIWLLGDGARPEGIAAHPRGLKLAQMDFLVPDGAEDFVVELVLERPDQVLHVDVVDRQGQAVEGAKVAYEVLMERVGGGEEHDVRSQTTDEGGRAEFALYRVMELRGIVLFATVPGVDGGVLVSEAHKLELPLPLDRDSTVRLVVDQAAGLLVRTVDEFKTPIQGCRVWLDVGNDPLFAWLPGEGDTDSDGEYRLDGLPGGSFHVNADSGLGRVRKSIEVHRGEPLEVELVLKGGTPRMAVSGVVLDEEGNPLPKVSVAVMVPSKETPAGRRLSRATDGEGRFEFMSPPCGELTVILDGGLGGDRFEPARSVVSFGERDLVFRRTRHFDRRRLDLELVDAVTGERLKEALVITARPPETDTYEFRDGSGGLLTMVVSEHPDVRLMIDSPGYRRASFAPLPLFSSTGERSSHTVEMERGILRWIEVRGDNGEESGSVVLVGAKVWQGSRLLGVTDESGRFELDLHGGRVEPVRVEAEGYRAELWSPEDGRGEPAPAQIWLSPVD